MNVATATPAQIDTEIARIQAELAPIYGAIDRAIAETERRRAAGTLSDTRRAQLEDIVDRATIAGGVLEGEVRPLHAEYTRRGRWTRYYLIEGGHLHYDVSGSRCSRIPSSSHYWLTEQSGKSADEVIELAGERVCTVCFPQAPVAVQERPSQLLTKSEAEKAQAREDRAEKARQAAQRKADKAITAPDGKPLMVSTWGRTEKVTTEAEAQRLYREAAAEILMVRDARFQLFLVKGQTQKEFDAQIEDKVANAETVIAVTLPALAAKHGISVADERAAHAKAITVKLRRDWKDSLQMRQVNIHFYANQGA